MAGLFEIAWPPLLKASNGFTRLGPTLIMFATMSLSFWLLSHSLREISIGTGYAVWTGVGAAGAVIVGMIYYGESRSILRVLCICLIIFGIVGLKVMSSPTPNNIPAPDSSQNGV
jgi:quaternary ammonium compound-resistance protein SugE